MIPPGFDILPSLEEVRGEITRRSFKRFVVAAWPTVEPGTKFLDNWHIDAICDHAVALYRRQIKRLLINIPPRFMKSSLMSVLFPAWIWLQDPSFKLISASYEYRLAVRDAIKSRSLMRSPFYRDLNVRDFVTKDPIFRLFDSQFAPNLKDQENWYQNDKGGQRFAVGVDGGSTGEGGSLISVDDPQNPKQASSEAHRIRALEWWDQTMSTRLDDPETGLKCITMQRLNVFDLTGHEVSKNLDYVHLKCPMEFDPRKRCVTVIGDTTWQDPRTEEGQLLWPERFSAGFVKQLKGDLGSYGTAGQLQQEPLPEGGGVFKLGWFKRWVTQLQWDCVALSMDSAFKDSDDSSYVVLQVWGFKGATAYLVDQVRGHLSFVNSCAAVIDLIAKHKPQQPISAIVIEDKANGAAIINTLSKLIPGIIAVNPKGSKESRAQAVSPFVEAGNVHIPADAPWVSDFLFELCNFPKAGHDDQVDALSQVLWWRYLKDEDVDRHQRKEKFLKWSALGESV